MNKTRMLVDEEVLDITILDEGFSLSALWLFRDEIREYRQHLIDCKEDTPKKLIMIDYNIEMVECVMIGRELDVFVTTEYGDFSLN